MKIDGVIDLLVDLWTCLSNGENKLCMVQHWANLCILKRVVL